MIKLLFVEDDDAFAYAIQGGLELLEEYEICRATNGHEAMSLYDAFCPDVVVADIEMPGINGYDLTRAIRVKNKNVVLLLASGLTSPKDLCEGYKLDIDEYVKKPYIAQELHCRIQAILKRMRKTVIPEEVPEEETGQIHIGRYVFDVEERTLSFDRKLTQKLTPLEADILSLLLGNRNRLVLRSDILQRFWGKDDSEFASRSLDVFICKLRKYLSHDSSIKIVNERGRGLRLVVG